MNTGVLTLKLVRPRCELVSSFLTHWSDWGDLLQSSAQVSLSLLYCLYLLFLSSSPPLLPLCCIFFLEGHASFPVSLFGIFLSPPFLSLTSDWCTWWDCKKKKENHWSHIHIIQRIKKQNKKIQPVYKFYPPVHKHWPHLLQHTSRSSPRSQHGSNWLD